jgi:hypothetical protein
MFGGKFNELRETNWYMQRQIAAEFEVDSAYKSIVENDEIPLSKSHLNYHSETFQSSRKRICSYLGFLQNIQ